MAKQVYLCYEDDSEEVSTARTILEKSGVLCHDCEKDIAINRPTLSQMDQFITSVKWVVVFIQRRHLESEIFTHQLDTEVHNAIDIKQTRNIIVVCNAEDVGSLPSELSLFPRIVLENNDWEDDLLNTVLKQPISIERGNYCSNKHHINIEKKLQETGFHCASEPECLPSASEDGERRHVIPRSQKRKVKAEAKRRKLETDRPKTSSGEHASKPQCPSRLRRLARQTQRKNWFYKQYIRHCAHSQTCCCYFFYVCIIPSFITNVFFLFWLLRASDQGNDLDNETVFFYVLDIIKQFCPLFLFWNCCGLFKQIKLFKHYRCICISQIFELLIFGVVCYTFRSDWILLRDVFKIRTRQNFKMLLMKAAESTATLTFFLSLSNRAKSSTYVDNALSAMVSVLTCEMFYTRHIILQQEWGWLADDTYFSSSNSVILRVCLFISWFWQLYILNDFIRDVYNDTLLPKYEIKCCKLQGWKWNWSAVMGFLLYSYFIYDSFHYLTA